MSFYDVATGFHLGHSEKGEQATFRLAVQKVVIDYEEISSGEFLSRLEKEIEESKDIRDRPLIYGDVFEHWVNDCSHQVDTIVYECSETETREVTFRFLYYPDILLSEGKMWMRDLPTIQIGRVIADQWMVALSVVTEDNHAGMDEEAMLHLFKWKREAVQASRMENVSFGSYRGT